MALVPNVQIIPDIGLFNSKRILQVGLLSLMALGLLVSRSARTAWLSTWNRMPFGARAGLMVLIGGAGLSIAGAPRPEFAGLELAHFVLLFVLIVLVAHGVQQQPQLTARSLVGIALLSVGLYAVQFAVGFILSLMSTEIVAWPDGFIGFSNIRHFNQFQTWTLPLLVVPLLGNPSRSRGLRMGAGALTALWWALIIASNVRGTVLAMGVAAIAVGMLFRHQAYPWLRYQAMGLVAGGALYFVLFYLLQGMEPMLVDRLSSGSQYAGRIEYWQAAAAMIAESPILGAGPMHFAWPPNYFGAGAHPHNALVQWVAEWGIPSALLLVGLVGWGFIAWIRQSKRVMFRRTAPIRIALTAALVAGAAHAMVSGIIVMPVSQIWGVLVIGTVWGLYLSVDRARTRWVPRTRAKVAQLAFCGLLAVSVAVVSWQSVDGIQHMQERRGAFLESVDRNLLSPRYWQQGFIGIRDVAAERVPLRPEAQAHAHVDHDQTQ